MPMAISILLTCKSMAQRKSGPEAQRGDQSRLLIEFPSDRFACRSRYRAQENGVAFQPLAT